MNLAAGTLVSARQGTKWRSAKVVDNAVEGVHARVKVKFIGATETVERLWADIDDKRAEKPVVKPARPPVVKPAGPPVVINLDSEDEQAAIYDAATSAPVNDASTSAPVNDAWTNGALTNEKARKAGIRAWLTGKQADPKAAELLRKKSRNVQKSAPQSSALGNSTHQPFSFARTVGKEPPPQKNKYGTLSYRSKSEGSVSSLGSPKLHAEDDESLIRARHPTLDVEDLRIPRMNKVGSIDFVKRSTSDYRIPRRINGYGSYDLGMGSWMQPGSVELQSPRRPPAKRVPSEHNRFDANARKRRRTINAEPVAPGFPVTPRFPLQKEQDGGTGEVDKVLKLCENDLKHEASKGDKKPKQITNKINPSCSATSRCRKKPNPKRDGHRRRRIPCAASVESSKDSSKEPHSPRDDLPGPRVLGCVCSGPGDIESSSFPGETIQCYHCHLWSHLKCLQLSAEQLSSLRSDDPRSNKFMCIRCADAFIDMEARPGISCGEVRTWRVFAKPLNLSAEICNANSTPDTDDLLFGDRRPRSRLKARKPSQPDYVQRRADNIEFLRNGMQALSFAGPEDLLRTSILSKSDPLG